jgi:hypothetical protein
LQNVIINAYSISFYLIGLGEVRTLKMEKGPSFKNSEKSKKRKEDKAARRNAVIAKYEGHRVQSAPKEAVHVPKEAVYAKEAAPFATFDTELQRYVTPSESATLHKPGKRSEGSIDEQKQAV